MRERLSPWLPVIFCASLSLITLVANVVGRFMTGNADVGLTAFICFLPMCFFHVGTMLKNLRDENRMLKHRLEEALLDGGQRESTARESG